MILSSTPVILLLEDTVVEITRRSRSQEPGGIVDEVPFRMENITQELTVVEDVQISLVLVNLLRIMI